MNFIITLLISAAAAAFTAQVSPQEQEAKEFKARYDMMVNRVGPDGVGIETLLDKWEAAYPDDVDMLQDMILAAVNEALRTADETRTNEMSKLAPGMGGMF